MQNNRAFQNLAPERQAQIRKNLENWNRLSPEERGEIRERAQILERMTPEQRQYLRNTLLPRWQEMPQERRQAINGRLRILQTMGPGAQQAALADPKFMQGLSPDEQSMLRDAEFLPQSASAVGFAQFSASFHTEPVAELRAARYFGWIEREADAERMNSKSAGIILRHGGRGIFAGVN